MVTERNSIQVGVQINEKVVRRMTKKLYVGSLIALIVGIVGLVAYIVTSAAYYAATEQDLVGVDAMLVFAVPFTVGLIFLLTLRKQYKTAAQQGERAFGYEFFSDCIVLREYRFGEQIGLARVAYPQIVKAVQTKDYLFFYHVRSAAYPIDKSALTEEELVTLQSLLRLPYAGEPLALSALPTAPEELAKEVNPAPRPEPPASPAPVKNGEDYGDIFDLSDGEGKMS